MTLQNLESQNIQLPTLVRHRMALPNLQSQNIQLPTLERHRMQFPNFQLSNMQSTQTSNVQSPNFEKQNMLPVQTSNMQPPKYFERQHMQGEQRKYMLPRYKPNVQVEQRRNMVAVERRYIQSEQRQDIYAAHRPDMRWYDTQRCNISDNNMQQQNIMQYQYQNEQSLDFSRRSVQEPNIPPIDLSRQEENFTDQLNELIAAWHPLWSNSSSSPESLTGTPTWSPHSNSTFSSPENLLPKHNLHSSPHKSPLNSSFESLPGGSKGN